MKIFLIPFLFLMVVFMSACNKTKDTSDINQTELNTNEANLISDDMPVVSIMSEQLNMLSTVKEGSEAQIWSLKEVKDFFHKNKIGQPNSAVTLDEKLYFDEGEAFAGIGIHLNSYKYLNMYYKNILANWQKLLDKVPGVYLSEEDAEIVVKFANITETEFDQEYPNWRNGEPVDANQ